MRTVKCIVVDDDIDATERLVELLNKIENVEVLSKIEDPKNASKIILDNRPEMVFIAVEMNFKSGFEIINEILVSHYFPTFIFVTKNDHYAIEAIRNSAFDYLLKPISIGDLKSAINRYRAEAVNHKTININECKLCNRLTEREKDVLLLYLNGAKNSEIAKILFITQATVDFHRRNIISKTEAKDIMDLILKLSNVKYVNYKSN